MYFGESNMPESQAQLEKLHAEFEQRTNFFPGQRPTEKVQLYIRTHWLQRAKIFSFFVLLGVLLPGGIFYFLMLANLPAKVWLIFELVETFYFLFAWLLTFIEFMKSDFTVVVVTNERVVDIAQKSAFDRQITETNLDRIQEVSGQIHGIWLNFFDIGQVEVQTAGSDVPLLMNFVKSPQLTARKILDIQRASQNRRRMSDTEKRSNDQVQKRAGENFSPEELRKMRGGSEPTRKPNSAV